MCLWRSSWGSRFGHELPLRSLSTLLTKPQPRCPIESCDIPSPLPPQDLCTCCHLYLHLIIFLLFSCSVVSDSLWPHGRQHPRPPCPSPSPTVCSNSCPSSRWCHPTNSSPVAPFSSCPQSSPTSGSFPVSWLFTSGGQSIEASASASVLPTSIQGWFPLGLTGSISLLPEGLSKVFSRTTVWKHQFFSTQLSLLSSSHIHSWLLEKP